MKATLAPSLVQKQLYTLCPGVSSAAAAKVQIWFRGLVPYVCQANAITIHTIQCQSLVVLECPKSIRVGSVLLASCWVYIATAVSGCAVYTRQYGHEAKRRGGWIRSPQPLIVLMCILPPTTNQGVK